jgi:serine/threonine protein kinase
MTSPSTHVYVLPQYTESNCEFLNHISPVSTSYLKEVLLQEEEWDDILVDDIIPVNKHSCLNEQTLEILRRLGNEDTENTIQHIHEFRQPIQLPPISIPNNKSTTVNKNISTNNKNILKKSKTSSKLLSTLKRSNSPAATIRPRSAPLLSHTLNKSMSMKDISKVLEKRKEKRKTELELINQKLASTSKRINIVH